MPEETVAPESSQASTLDTSAPDTSSQGSYVSELMEPALHELNAPLSSVKFKAPHVEAESNIPEPSAETPTSTETAPVQTVKTDSVPKTTKPTI